MAEQPEGRELVPDTGVLFYPDEKGKLSALVIFPDTQLALEIAVREHGHNRKQEFWPTVYGITDWDYGAKSFGGKPHVIDMADDDYKTFSTSFNGPEDEEEIKKTIEGYGVAGILRGIQGDPSPKLVDNETALVMLKAYFEYWKPEQKIQIWQRPKPKSLSAQPLKAKPFKAG